MGGDLNCVRVQVDPYSELNLYVDYDYEEDHQMNGIQEREEDPLLSHRDLSQLLMMNCCS